ncbi:MAG: PepSY-associated TM helix domain-containing protein [Flavitalea sp.]
MYKNESKGSKARRLVLPVHSGSIYGWPTKILAFISVLFAASLPVTGFMIWWNRTNINKKPKQSQKKVIKKVKPEPTVEAL